MRALLLSLLLASGLAAAERPPAAAQPQSFVIGISPYLERSVKDEVYRGIVRLMVEDLPLNSNLSIYDGFELKSITQLKLPNARAFTSAKTRANQFSSVMGELKRFLAMEPPIPTNNSRLNFAGALRLPQFCDFLAENAPAGGSPLHLLLIGSPLYQDLKEPGFSMADGYFPSDGHLQASREQTPFGFSGQANLMRPLVVHWLYFGDPWVSDLHREKVTRFWALYLQRRAARSATFCGDAPTAFRAFGQGDTNLSSTAQQWPIDRQQTKIEMLRITRNVEIADWLTRDRLPEYNLHPPAVLVGPMKIGIRWKANIDLDLYATPHPGAETLFFQHTRSPEGYYYKDHRSSPGREYEFIEFESPVDIREVEAFVNFYKGSRPGGPNGEVRIEFDGKIYGAAFQVPAIEGNLGRTGRSQQDFWTRIPVQQILRVSPSEAPTG